MGQIEDLRMYVAVVDSGGIARAADVLGIAKSAVSRRLSQLEDRYGMRLIDRQPRTWEVTTAGQELYQRASLMVADAEDLDADFMHAAHSLRGPLRVSIAREFGLSFLKPTLFAFLQAHPQIDMVVDFDDRMADLENENYDLGVRIASDDLDGLVHLPLGVTRHGLFASPDYAARHGLPETLADLPKHSLLHYGAARRARWEFLSEGKTRAIAFQPALNSNNGPFLLDAAAQGLGIIKLPDFMVAQARQAGEVIPVLTHCEMPVYRIQVVYPASRRINKRMRALIDMLQAGCRTLLA